MAEFITSMQNPLLNKISKLNIKKHSDETGLFLFEGRKLFIEAKTSGIEILYLFVTQPYYELYSNEISHETVYVLSKSCFNKISSEKSSDGIICTAKHIDFLHFYIKIYNNHDDLFKSNQEQRLFLASGIQDPGNLGTIIRTANALGIDRLITDRDCSGLYNTKTIRATMGALFRQHIAVSDNMSDTIRYLKSIGYTIYAAAPDRNANRLDQLKLTDKSCFLIGNEGHGLDISLIRETSGCVFIPMEQETESLNAAVAAGILMWEGYKQRNN